MFLMSLFYGRRQISKDETSCLAVFSFSNFSSIGDRLGALEWPIDVRVLQGCLDSSVFLQKSPFRDL